MLALRVTACVEYLPLSALDHHMYEDHCHFYVCFTCLCPYQVPSINLFLGPCPNYPNTDLHQE